MFSLLIPTVRPAMDQGSKPARPLELKATLVAVVSVAVIAGVALTVLFAFPPAEPSASTCQGSGCGFEWGAPVNETGSGNPECPYNYCYVVPIAEPGTGNASIVNLHLRLITPSGQVLQWPNGVNGSRIDSVLLVGEPGNEPCATYDEFSNTWFWNSSFAGSVSDDYSILIHTGGVGSSFGLRGDSLSESGFGGVPGLVVSAPFP